MSREKSGKEISNSASHFCGISKTISVKNGQQIKRKKLTKIFSNKFLINRIGNKILTITALLSVKIVNIINMVLALPCETW